MSYGYVKLEGREGLDAVANYLIDLLIRCRFLLDKQMNSLEEKHRKEGGYNENLLKKRLDYKKTNIKKLHLPQHFFKC